MRRRSSLALALLSALMVTACGAGATKTGGGYNAPVGSSAPARFDARDAPLACLHGKGIQAVKATPVGEENRIDILPVTAGASIVFDASPTATQNAQLNNQDPGAEMIGPAIFTVGSLPDAQLQKIEKCLEAQGSKY